MSLLGNKKKYIFCFVMLFISVIFCFFYYKILSSKYIGNIPLSVEKNIEKSEPVALSHGEYQLTLEYSSETDSEISIIGKYSGVSCNQLLAAGNNMTATVNIAIPTDDYHININLTNPIDCHNLILYSDKEIFTDSLAKTLLLFFLLVITSIFLLSDTFINSSALQKTLWLCCGIAFIIHCLPHFGNCVMSGYDGHVQMGRIIGVYDALKDGQFPTSIYPNVYNGFGMLGRMYPQLFLYPLALLVRFHVSVFGVYQIFIILISVLSGFTMYISVRKITNSHISSSLATIFFELFIYYLDDVYMRNAIGEIIALSFIPLIVTGIYIISHTEEKKGWLWILIGYTGIVQSHVVSCVLAAIMIFCLILLNIKHLLHPAKIKQLLLAAVLIILVNLATLIPMITYMHEGLNTAIMLVTFTQNATPILGAFDLCPWNLPTIGIISILFLIMMAFASICSAFPKRQFISSLLIMGIISIILTTDFLPWKSIEKLNIFRLLNGYIQYSYRFFGLTTICLSMGSAIAIEEFMDIVRNKKALYFSVPSIFIILAIITAIPYTSYSNEKGDSRLLGGLEHLLIQDYMPLGAYEACWNKNPDLFLSNAGINISSYEKNGTHILCQFYVSEDYNHIDFPLFYYPGYRATYYVPSNMDGIDIPITRGDESRIRIVIPYTNEIAAIEIQYVGLWYYYIGYCISILAILYTAFICLRRQ